MPRSHSKLVALRSPGAYLLLRTGWFLAPIATGATLAAAAMSAWAVWEPGAWEGDRPRFPAAGSVRSLKRGDLAHHRRAALVLEVKGDFCFAVRDMVEASGRADDCEISLGGRGRGTRSTSWRSTPARWHTRLAR